MSGLAETIARLARMTPPGTAPAPAASSGRLSPFAGFGSNPGQLLAMSYLPDHLAPGAALVVVLHGCTQTAAGYDRGAGWSRLADEAGFALLFPEQQRANNANLCFNWFERDDVTCGSGEALSIRQMVAAMLARHGLDPARVYVTGLSAGGAMTSALLAAYPDVFAGGAIIAGLPYGTARGVPEALQQMRAAAPIPTVGLRDAIRAATGHDGRLPTVSVWHGDTDRTVDASNAAAIVAQWRAIHDAVADPQDQRIDGQRRLVWHDPAGRAVVESWTIAGMGHGTPLNTIGPDACGVAGAHMLDAGISSTRHIARFWGLLPAPVARPRGVPDRPPVVPHAAPLAPPLRPSPPPGAVDPGTVIERALRAAGLMQ